MEFIIGNRRLKLYPNGVIKSRAIMRGNETKNEKWDIIKFSENGGGYLVCGLTVDGKQKTLRKHRILHLARNPGWDIFDSSPNNCMLACNYARKAALNDPITYKDYYCNSVVYIPPNKTDPGKCFFRNEKESNPFKQEKCQSYKHAITYSSFFNEPYLNDSTKLQYDMNKCDMNTSYELSSPNVYTSGFSK